MTPVQLNIYFAICGALIGIIATALTLNIKHDKKVTLARKFSFEQGTNFARLDSRKRLDQAYERGFNEGLEWEDYLDSLEMEIEELTDDKLPSRYSQAVGKPYDLKISADEEREMLREALANYA